MTDFVYTSGTRLMLNGVRFKANGSNVYDLLDSTTTEANTRLTELANAGCTTVRTWAFSNDGTTGVDFLSRLDTALANANTLGLKLILTLSNYFNDWGGPLDFGDDQTTFFQHFNATWKAQIESLVNTYKDNTTIMAWEIMNEPRPNNDETSMAWLEMVAAAIKAIDTNHLVCSGSEGFLGGDPYPATGSESGASADINMTALNSGANIDIASMHFYTKYISGDYRPDTAKTLTAIAAAKAVTDTLGKPLIIGEAGYDPNDYGGNTARRQYFTDVAQACSTADVDGALIWNWGRLPVSSFTLAATDSESDAILANWMSILNGRILAGSRTASNRSASSSRTAAGNRQS